MNEESKNKARKSAAEELRKIRRTLHSVGDHGTVMKIDDIIERLVERRKVSMVMQKLNS